MTLEILAQWHEAQVKPWRELASAAHDLYFLKDAARYERQALFHEEAGLMLRAAQEFSDSQPSTLTTSRA